MDTESDRGHQMQRWLTEFTADPYRQNVGLFQDHYQIIEQ